MLLGFNAYAATKNVVPRNDQEGQLGTRTKQWGSVVATGAVIRNVEVSTLTEVRQIRFVGTTATQTTPMTQNTTFFVNASSASYVGVINESTNPVDWSMLKNVPAGFADGADALGGGLPLPEGATNYIQHSTVATSGVMNITSGTVSNLNVGTGLSIFPSGSITFNGGGNLINNVGNFDFRTVGDFHFGYGNNNFVTHFGDTGQDANIHLTGSYGRNTENVGARFHSNSLAGETTPQMILSTGSTVLFGVYVSSIDIGVPVTVPSMTVTGDMRITGLYRGDGSALTGISAGSTGFSTKTYTFLAGGDVFLATNTFSPLGLSDTVSKSTWNIIDVRSEVTYKDTNNSIRFQLAWSTALTGGYNSWTYVTPQVEIATGNTYSNWISTAFIIKPDVRFALHCTTAGSNTASQYRWKMRYWAQDEP